MSERVPGVSDDVERRILELAGRAPPRMRLSARVALALSAAFGAAVVTVVVHPRPDLHQLPLAALALSTAALLAIAIATTAGAAWSRRSTGPSVRLLRVAALGTAPLSALIAATGPLATGSGPASVSSAITGAVGCLATMCAAAGVGLLALLAAFRHAVPVAPHLRGAALGAAAGAVGGVAMHLRCPSFDPVHIVLGHVLPIAIMAGIGALVGPRVVRT